jgi:hypothetical protein
MRLGNSVNLRAELETDIAASSECSMIAAAQVADR